MKFTKSENVSPFPPSHQFEPVSQCLQYLHSTVSSRQLLHKLDPGHRRRRHPELWNEQKFSKAIDLIMKSHIQTHFDKCPAIKIGLTATKREKVAMILNKFISDINEFETTCYMPVGCFHSEFINALLSPRAWHHFTIFSKKRSADNFFCFTANLNSLICTLYLQSTQCG